MNEEQTPQISENQLEQPKKLGKNFIFLITILVIVLAGAGLLFATSKVSKEIKEQKVEVAVPDPYAGWETYRNEEFGFEFGYPNDLVVEDYFDAPETNYYSDSVAFYKNEEVRGEMSEYYYINMRMTELSELIEKSSVEDCAGGTLAGYFKCTEFRGTGPNDEVNVQGIHWLTRYFEGLDSAGTEFYSQQKDKVFIVIFNEKLEKDSIEGVLSTFKFIELDETADWKTYQDEEYGFEFMYPPQFGDPVERTTQRILSCEENDDQIVIATFENLSLIWTCSEYLERLQPYKGEMRTMIVAGKESYYLNYTSSTNYTNSEIYIPLSGSVYLSLVHSYKTGFPEYYLELSNGQFQKIIDSFKFIEPQAEQTEPAPVINSITPQSGKIGTVIILKGENLAGFEGDLDAWIENENGEIAYLGQYGKSVYPETNQITVQITEKVCRTNESYRGDPCKEYMTITPGAYKIYTRPWGVESNKVQFDILE